MWLLLLLLLLPSFYRAKNWCAQCRQTFIVCFGAEIIIRNWNRSLSIYATPQRWFGRFLPFLLRFTLQYEPLKRTRIGLHIKLFGREKCWAGCRSRESFCFCFWQMWSHLRKTGAHFNLKKLNFSSFLQVGHSASWFRRSSDCEVVVYGF